MLRRGFVVGIVHDYLVYVLENPDYDTQNEMTSFVGNRKPKTKQFKLKFEREREVVMWGGRDFIDTGRNICSDKRSRSLKARCKVVHQPLGPTGLMDLPFVDTLLGDADTSKVLEEGVQPGYSMRLVWSGQTTAERKRIEVVVGGEVNSQPLPMIPARPGSSGASGSIVPEMIVEGHCKTSTVSSGSLRIVERH